MPPVVSRLLGTQQAGGVLACGGACFNSMAPQVCTMPPGKLGRLSSGPVGPGR